MVMYNWESEFKTKEKSIWTKEKIAPQHLFTAFLLNFKGCNNSIQSTSVSSFYEDDEIISWFSKTKYIKADEEEYLGHFVFVDV